MEQIKKLLKPPCGNEVRKAVGIFTFGVGVTRLIPGAQVGALRFADPVVYGIPMTVIGIALLMTCNGRRNTVLGKVVAGVAFVSWAMLAAATTSLTSLWFNITIAAILLMEVYKNEPCE